MPPKESWQSDSQWEDPVPHTSALTRASAQTPATSSPMLPEAASQPAHQPGKGVGQDIAKQVRTTITLYSSGFLFSTSTARQCSSTTAQSLDNCSPPAGRLFHHPEVSRTRWASRRWSHLEPAFLGYSKAAVTMRRAAARVMIRTLTARSGPGTVLNALTGMRIQGGAHVSGGSSTPLPRTCLGPLPEPSYRSSALKAPSIFCE